MKEKTWRKTGMDLKKRLQFYDNNIEKERERERKRNRWIVKSYLVTNSRYYYRAVSEPVRPDIHKTYCKSK